MDGGSHGERRADSPVVTTEHVELALAEILVGVTVRNCGSVRDAKQEIGEVSAEDGNYGAGRGGGKTGELEGTAWIRLSDVVERETRVVGTPAEFVTAAAPRCVVGELSGLIVRDPGNLGFAERADSTGKTQCPADPS